MFYKLNKLARRFLWWCAGANVSVLNNIKSDWNKYSAIGLVNLMSSVIAFCSCAYLMSFVTNYLAAQLVIGIFWSLLILSINRAMQVTITKGNLTGNIVTLIPRLLMALCIASITIIALELKVFENLIGNNQSIIERLIKLQAIKEKNSSIQILSIIITTLFVTIELIPIITRMVAAKKIGYEEALESTRSAELRLNAEEIDFRMHGNNFEHRKKIQEKEYELERQKIQNDVGLETLKKVSAVKKHDDSIEGFEFYIDYKILSLSEINDLLHSINQLYNTIYAINNDLDSVDKSRVEEYLKTHPEDVLILLSIETGNSIKFKVTTGWKPKFGVDGEDGVIYLPEGSVSLLITGFIILQMFSYGVSQYKELLEVQKLKKEQTLLEYQIQDFKKKISQADDISKAKLQEDLNRLYHETIANSNYRSTEVTIDPRILEDIKKGKLLLPGINDSTNLE